MEEGVGGNFHLPLVEKLGEAQFDRGWGMGGSFHLPLVEELVEAQFDERSYDIYRAYCQLE